MMNLLELKADLENKLNNAMSNLKNLDRMAQQCFSEIDKRAQEDVDRINYRATEAKENFAIIFMSLTKAEEATISLLRQDLGLDKLLPQSREDTFDTEYNKLIDVSTEVSTLRKKIKDKKDATI